MRALPLLTLLVGSCMDGASVGSQFFARGE